jgi:hypothetical protein
MLDTFSGFFGLWRLDKIQPKTSIFRLDWYPGSPKAKNLSGRVTWHTTKSAEKFQKITKNRQKNRLTPSMSSRTTGTL